MTFEIAAKWAIDQHAGQVYHHPGHGDQPYACHLFRVAGRVSPRARVAAILHDTVEDGGVLPATLHDTDRAAVRLLTRDKDAETYAEYIERLAAADGPAGDIAREVKLADLWDNIGNTGPGHRAELRGRYMRAITRLTEESAVRYAGA